MFYRAVAALVGMLSLYWLSQPFQAQLTAGGAILCLFIDRILGKRFGILSFFSLGVLWACIHLLFWFYQTRQIIPQNQVAQIAGYVCSIPQSSNQTTRFDFCVDRIGKRTLAFWQSNKIRVTWGKYAVVADPIVKAGQHWQLQVKLKPVHGKVNLHAFDYEKWLVSENYIGTASVRKRAQLLTGFNPSASYHKYRQAIFDKLFQLTADNASQGLMLALLMGERGGLSDDNWKVFQASGTAHLLAISGLHIGIAALWSYWIISFLWRRSKRLCRWIATPLAAEVASLAGALILYALSGLGLPATRAVIMLSIFLVCRWSGIYLRMLNVLGFALLLILIIHPFAVLSMSFWLSFSAVLTIALVLDREIAQAHPWLSWLKINGFLYLAMMPVSWLFFGQVSWVALLANLILIPLTTFILTPLLYIGAILSLFAAHLSKFVFDVVDWIFSLSYVLQSHFANWNSLLEFHSLPGGAILAATLLLVLIILPRKLPFKWLALPLSVMLLLPGSSSREQQSLLKVWVFDIGQGLAIYMETPQNNLIYDTGWGNRDYALIKSSVLPFIKRQGIQHIDKVIISHDDADHSGGLPWLKELVSVDEIIAGESLLTSPSTSCHRYPNWIWQGLLFEFIKVVKPGVHQGNNSSCILAVKAEDFSLLLPGDIERQVERILLRQGISQFDFLIAPHHGSNTSSTQSFVESVQPKHVIFSTGFGNQWAFPKQQVVDRYQAINSQIWVTHRDGAIFIELDNNGQVEIDGLRHSSSYFWRQGAQIVKQN